MNLISRHFQNLKGIEMKQVCTFSDFMLFRAFDLITDQVSLGLFLRLRLIEVMRDKQCCGGMHTKTKFHNGMYFTIGCILK